MQEHDEVLWPRVSVLDFAFITVRVDREFGVVKAPIRFLDSSLSRNRDLLFNAALGFNVAIGVVVSLLAIEGAGGRAGGTVGGRGLEVGHGRVGGVRALFGFFYGGMTRLLNRDGQRIEATAGKVVVHAQPVFGVVNRDEILDELLVRLADPASLALFRTEHVVIIERVVDHGVAEILQMDPDLMHAPGLGPTKDHAGPAIEAQPLEVGVAILAARRDLTDANLVRDDLNWLLAYDRVPAKSNRIDVTKDNELLVRRIGNLYLYQKWPRSRQRSGLCFLVMISVEAQEEGKPSLGNFSARGMQLDKQSIAILYILLHTP